MVWLPAPEKTRSARQPPDTSHQLLSSTVAPGPCASNREHHVATSTIQYNIVWLADAPAKTLSANCSGVRAARAKKNTADKQASSKAQHRQLASQEHRRKHSAQLDAGWRRHPHSIRPWQLPAFHENSRVPEQMRHEEWFGCQRRRRHAALGNLPTLSASCSGVRAEGLSDILDMLL